MMSTIGNPILIGGGDPHYLGTVTADGSVGTYGQLTYTLPGEGFYVFVAHDAPVFTPATDPHYRQPLGAYILYQTGTGTYDVPVATLISSQSAMIGSAITFNGTDITITGGNWYRLNGSPTFDVYKVADRPS